ncbi:hypothetical protein EG329_013556 [Mollisiaceae sp. DMI_Dod_QoI]|nr:hypothetical protein EG329_013556 [Helotiales sp. DMI_Dod_QoI]
MIHHVVNQHGAFAAEMKTKKVCFVTTGATAEFRELIQAVLSPDCLRALKDEGFTTMNFQCGDTLKDFPSLMPHNILGMELNAFAFKKDGLNRDMRECQALEGQREQGLIILHAGAGTVMDAMRLGLSMVVVPNTSLLDNHQDELALELDAQNYATRSDIPGLANAIRLACLKQARPWAPQKTVLKKIVDETVGYNEDVSSRLVLD